MVPEASAIDPKPSISLSRGSNNLLAYCNGKLAAGQTAFQGELEEIRAAIPPGVHIFQIDCVGLLSAKAPGQRAQLAPSRLFCMRA